MTPDEIIKEGFRLQEKHDPDSDPGDLSIEVQDDMPMVAVYQDNAPLFSMPIMGKTVQEALEAWLEEVKGRVGT